MKHLLLSCSFVAALSMHGHAFVPLLEDDWGQADREKLQGRWRVIRFEQYGRECKATTRNFQGLEYIIDGNKFSFWDIEAQQFRWQGTFTIDPLKKQKQIDVKRKDGWSNLDGIYDIHADTLKWCIPGTSEERPKQIATTENNSHLLLVMERVKK